jgi:hypothetical protein
LYETETLKVLKTFKVFQSEPVRLRLASWLSYGMVRFMTGMAGYAPKATLKKN